VAAVSSVLEIRYLKFIVPGKEGLGKVSPSFPLFEHELWCPRKETVNIIFGQSVPFLMGGIMVLLAARLVLCCR
jgi:hypothetical protein